MKKNCHRIFMMRALELAGKAKGKTFPNPMVGAVIVKNGKIVGEGYHKKAGEPHAEVIALRKTKKKDRKGSSLYVTLEPCAHYGKTPPCVYPIIESGVKRIYVAMRDPNPLVDGMGLRILRESGVKIKSGVCREEARRLNRRYLNYITKKAPAKYSRDNKDVYGHY